MRFLPVLFLFSLVILAFGTAAHARDRSWIDWIFTPKVGDYERSYLYEGKIPHLHTWDDGDWSPQRWVENGGGETEMLGRLYNSGIITDQYMDGNVPVLEVGQNFMRLSNQDRTRVVAFVDHIFGITRSFENGGFQIVHAGTEQPIGIYTASGLQLQ